LPHVLDDRRLLMNEQDRHNLFSDLLAPCQSRVYAYIFAIVRDQEDADDLFQTVCLTLWRKFPQFRPGSSFFSWARQVAQNEVRDFLKRRKRPSHVSDELLEVFAVAVATAHSDATTDYLDALRHCREKLTSADEELLCLRYVENLGSRQIADRLNRPQQSVCNSLTRIRGWLLDCVMAEFGRQERAVEDRQ
jgi:RNA polymerase sigma-70 factor, ECF subfamily